MFKSIDDNKFSIINRDIVLSDKFKKLSSDARNILLTLIIKNKNSHNKLKIVGLNSKNIFNLSNVAMNKAINELIDVEYLFKSNENSTYILNI